VNTLHPLIDIENDSRPPFGVEVGKQGKGHKIAAREMVLGEALQIETEGTVTIDDEQWPIVTEQPAVPREGETSGCSHQVVLEREYDIDTREFDPVDSFGHVLGQVENVDHYPRGSSRCR
jgi:hypothetical protein